MGQMRQYLIVLLLPIIAAGLAAAPPAVLPAATSGLAPPHRVVILPPVLAGYATLERSLRHVAGVSKIVKEQFKPDILSRVYPGIGALPSAGMIAPADPEIILSLHPDAVVTWKSSSALLATFGLPGLVPVDPSPADESRLAMWSQLAKVSGTTERADSLRAYYQMRRGELKAVVDGHPEHPRLAFFIGSSGFGFLFGRILHLNGPIDFLHATNVSQSIRISTPVNLESVVALDPEIIFLGSELSEQDPKKLYSLPEWQILRAVQQRKVYRMPPSHFLVPVLDEVLLLQWFAEILYPDIPQVLRSTYQETFAIIHNAKLSDDDLDQILSLDKNSASVGYERFARTGRPIPIGISSP